MFSATMDPGAGGFRTPVPVDFDIGKATSTFPDLAMSRGGLAYLVYNVVTDRSPSNPTGYVGLDVRLAALLEPALDARSAPGSTATRAIPMRIADRGDRDRGSGIDVQGQAVVAWLEPDDDFIDRVWARRVFGGQTGIPLQVSPSKWEDKPLRGAVNGFSLDVSGFGQAAVAFRQQPGQASALDGAAGDDQRDARSVFTQGADNFGDAQLADDELQDSLGVPAVAVDPVGIFSTRLRLGPGDAAQHRRRVLALRSRRIDDAASTIEAARRSISPRAGRAWSPGASCVRRAAPSRSRSDEPMASTNRRP